MVTPGDWHHRSGSVTLTIFGQSTRWTVIPRPRVTNPMIASPFTGRQQVAKFVNRSPTPITCKRGGVRGA